MIAQWMRPHRRPRVQGFSAFAAGTRIELLSLAAQLGGGPALAQASRWRAGSNSSN
jgi:hypothetical protein